MRNAMVVSELLVDAVNGGVQGLFLNEKRIEFEIRALVSTILRYKKQTDAWLAASQALNSVLKVCFFVLIRCLSCCLSVISWIALGFQSHAVIKISVWYFFPLNSISKICNGPEIA